MSITARDLATHALTRIDAIMEQTVALADDHDEATAIALMVAVGVVSRTSETLTPTVPGYSSLEETDQIAALVSVIAAYLITGKPRAAPTPELNAVVSNMRKLVHRRFLS